ncbi:MAG: hypothetical protein Q4C45_06170 [Oscillospiraceae bacterium]|nr:hypothetical protein [Oscillospiraceae bacterium]
MKIYSKGTFALALLWLGLGLEKLIRCLWGRGPDGSDLLWLVICGINVVVNLYTALDEERSEVRKRSVEKSRRIARAKREQI